MSQTVGVILNNVTENPTTSSAKIRTVSTVVSGTATEIKTSQDLSVAVLDYSTNQTSDFIVSNIAIKFSGNVSETITISKVGSDANYTTIIDESTLSGAKNYFYLPDNELKIFGTDGQQLQIECTNTGGSETAYVTLNLEVV